MDLMLLLHFQRAEYCEARLWTKKICKGFSNLLISKKMPKKDCVQTNFILIWENVNSYFLKSTNFLQNEKKNCKQGMLFSIVPCFGNRWFLLCLEWLDADWLSGCVCLEGLHSDCFCCMWYCYHAFSLDECPFCPVGGRIFYCACILIG